MQCTVIPARIMRPLVPNKCQVRSTRNSKQVKGDDREMESGEVKSDADFRYHEVERAKVMMETESEK